MKNYIMLDLYAGYAEDVHLSHILVTWIRKTKFKTARALRDKFVDDFIEVAMKMFPKREPLSNDAIVELETKNYDVPDADESYDLAGIFMRFMESSIDSSVRFVEELDNRGWHIDNYKTGTVAVISNFDGYLSWLDNGHNKKDIPEWCAEILRTYDIKL